MILYFKDSYQYMLPCYQTEVKWYGKFSNVALHVNNSIHFRLSSGYYIYQYDVKWNHKKDKIKKVSQGV